MIDKRLLIVEDNVAESIYAQGEACRVGFRDVVAVTTLADARKYLPESDLVVSDLFFPAGNEATEQHVKRFLPLYEKYAKDAFISDRKDGVVLRAIEQCAKIFGMTPTEYVETVIARSDSPEMLVKAAREAVSGIINPEKYAEYQKIEEKIKAGTNLPLGIVVTEQALEKGLPAVIVTSTYHHSVEFEPVRNLVRVKYFDSLVDGRKNWKDGVDYLVNGGNN